MPAPQRIGPRRRLLRAPVACALVAVLAATALTAQAAAAPDTKPDASPQAQEETSALAKAARTGERAEVVSHRTQFSSVFANPDGTFTQDTSAIPIRVRQDQALVDVDTTLERKSGLVRAKAVDVGLEFSAGGDTPLVKITRNDRSVTVDWPGALPAPRLEGDTAVYPEVEPGIDLQLKAGVDGYQQLLVVKTRQAAANPLLKQVHYSLATDGVEVKADAAGNLKATNPAGQEVFTAPAPEMWDSAGIPDAQLPSPSAERLDVLLNEEGGKPASRDEDVFEPRYGSTNAEMPIEVGDDELTLTPDQKVLQDPGTVYPVYIDPTLSSPRLGWTSVSKAYPTTSYWNHSSNVARVGHENETSGTWRSFLQFDTRSLHHKQITKSTLRIKNTHSWSCTKKPVEAWLTGGISSSTTWSKQPAWNDHYATVTDAKGWSSACPAGNLEFNVKGATERAANGTWNQVTFGLRASESDVYAWKKFDASTAVLSTAYNSAPNTPAGLDTVPSTRINNTCGDQGTYVTVGNTDVQLTAKVSDPDGGTVTARFHLWPTGKRDVSPGLIVDRDVNVTSGGIARTTISKSLLTQHLGAANGSYSWKVQTRDTSTASNWNPTLGAPGCRFVFDPNRPSTPPHITSTQFPSGEDGWPTNTGPARSEGNFTMSADGVADVVKYEYWTDWDPTVRTATVSAGASTTVKLTPPSTGPQRAYARSLDKAGNRSDTTVYLFYADPTGTVDEPGDLNGDGNPDLTGVRSDGELWLYAGQGNGRLGVSAKASPHSFDSSLITHRGDWTHDGYEDLIASTGAKGSRQLHIYPNNGFGHSCTDHEEEASGSMCADKRRDLSVYDEANDHFKDADQILAVGDVDGPTDLDSDGAIGEWDLPSFPDLLVKEGDHLWLYYGHLGGFLDEYAAPVLIGNGGWANYDLAAPGDVTTNGRVDLLARKRSTGELFLYTGTGDNGEGLGGGNRQVVATGFTPTARPLFTSGTDADNDGVPDLWTTTDQASAGLYFHLRITPTGIGSPATVGTSGWGNFQRLS
ncbi:FG-GAP-like repeat-containing protein [Streptomyces sp. N35]|uniref:FG-GAP-like repeat-containing protein n=1 Tax=Streptomyces sp. N35 TaxID=2795730 RepID=UPI001F24209A|nr:FG-GAP-like repeat-containing protein [Streptomyces sp. N35]